MWAMCAHGSRWAHTSLLLLLVLVVLQSRVRGQGGRRPFRRAQRLQQPVVVDASEQTQQAVPLPARRPALRRSMAIARARAAAMQSLELEDIDLPPEQLQRLQAQPSGQLLEGADPFSQMSAEQGVGPPPVAAFSGVTFYLFTRTSARVLRVGEEDSLASSGFRANRPTKVLIHGFGGNANRTMMASIRNAYLEALDVNVVSVDWAPLAAVPWYRLARTHVELVGPRVAALLDWLAAHGASPSSVHLVGHSLGAHVAGIAGAVVRSGQVGRISGLDPARPGFRDVDLRGRLDPGDAIFVDVIHTTAGLLGLEQPLGHIDYYPNGGRATQPGCINDLAGLCSHEKAFKIFRDSISDLAFPARQCATHLDAMAGACSGAVAGMGEHASQRTPGIYYSVTD